MPTHKEINVKFTRIKSPYSEVIQLPILGKIRLGLKVRNRQGKEYPTETDYFVCPQEVREAIGQEQPKELPIMFASNDPEEVFIQRLAWYGQSSGLKCQGNMEVARRYDEKTKTWVNRECPCEHLKSAENPHGECTEQSYLRVFIPPVGFGGCYQITTGSYHSTVQLNSQIKLILGLTGGRLALIPMKLRRVPRQVTHEGRARTHYTLELVFNPTLEQIDHIRSNSEALLIPSRYQLAPPIESNPVLDPVDQEVDDEDSQNDTQADAADLADVKSKLAQAQGKAGAPTPAPKSASSAPAPTNGKWQEVLTWIDHSSQATDLLQEWKQLHDVENVARLNEEGKKSLMDYLKMNMAFPF